jgi:CHASE2 domain-containing sensor protein
VSRPRLAGLIAALIAAALILAMGAGLRQPLFDLWQRLNPRDLSDTQVRVVLIDSDALAEVGPWPWPRSRLAELTDQLAKSGAKAIGFDMLLAEQDRLRSLRRNPGRLVGATVTGRKACACDRCCARRARARRRIGRGGFDPSGRGRRAPEHDT